MSIIDEKQILIVGGGFGGVWCALDLAKKKLPNAKIRLISNEKHFDYHAALYRLVGGRSPLETYIPLYDIFKGRDVEVCEDTVTSINFDDNCMYGESGAVYKYDYLVLAVGSKTAYYNISGVEKRAFGMRSVNDALKLRKHLHEIIGKSFEDRKDDEYAHHIVIIGAGATGVELAGELAVYVRNLAKNQDVNPQKVKIDLVDMSDRILPTMSQEISEIVTDRLKKLGVNLYLNKRVIREDIDTLHLVDMELKTKTVIWTAGAEPVELIKDVEFEKDESGRLLVDGKLNPQNTDLDNVFVIGDIASTQYSGMAQTAITDGLHVSEILSNMVLNSEVKDFNYEPKEPIYAIPVGPGWAVYVDGKRRHVGIVGWYLRRLLDLKIMLQILPPMKAWKVFKHGGKIDDAFLN